MRITASPVALTFTVVLLLEFSLTECSSVSKLNYRLPPNIVPSIYNLSLRMVLDDNTQFTQFTAPGIVEILIDVINATNTITLNSQYIQIVESDTRVFQEPDHIATEILSHSYEPELHFYHINLAKMLLAGESYKLYIPFTSQILTNDTYGLYRSYYMDSSTNETRNLATTFFQPFGARLAFPCFDEPGFKAVFNIKVGRTAKYNSLANMDLKGSTEDPIYTGWIWDEFNSSPLMSTYLACFVVSDFLYEESSSEINPEKTVKVWGTPEKILNGNGKFAAEMSAKILAWYSNYTGIKYTLPKLDSIGIPQFQAGAMENWGLNTYREQYLLLDPNNEDESVKTGISETLSHEISHSWFGNLVTCQWWDQMWLNEGLATFFTYKGLISILPELDVEMRYIEKHQFNSLKFDSNENLSHPVVIETESGFNFFDGTSMEKGGALSRMMEYVFSPSIFQKAIQSYLKKQLSSSDFSTVHQNDLFDEMQMEIDNLQEQEQNKILPLGITVKQIMDTWTLQTGYPIVRVFRNESKLFLTQENIIQSQPNHRWWIPVNIVSQQNPDFSSNIPMLWMSPEESTAIYELDDSEMNGWLIINSNAAGFYRTIYDANLKKLLQTELLENPNAFNSITKAQIQNDFLYQEETYFKSQ